MIAAAAQASAAGAAPVAAPTFAVPAPAPLEPVTSLGAMLEIMLALAFVLAVILAIAWASRRLRGTSDAHGLIRVIADVSLGQKERAVLLQVDGRRLLVGVTSGGVSLLHSADAPAEAAAGSIDAQSGAGVAPSFAALLRRSLGRP
jgi:flagellar protein FliO/FliZ